MIQSIEYCGPFIMAMSLPGERRADGVAPTHPNGLQLSRDRFLILISTLGFRGVDDALSICYQLRAGSYAGEVIAEGVLAQSVNDWQPLDDERKFVRQFGHPVAFGVPKGALIEGRSAPHENCFALKFRQCARVLHPDGYLLWNAHPHGLDEKTQNVQWLQFRLNDAEDDIEITAPQSTLRQRGYEEGARFCEIETARNINQSYVQPVPYNRAADEWVDICHFNWGDMHHEGTVMIAALKYRFNPQTRLYEWMETGPPAEGEFFEGNISRHGDDWIIAARPTPCKDVGWSQRPIGWACVRDPFVEKPQMTFPPELICNAPLSVYHCADGVLRLFTGNAQASPHDSSRNPLYCWEIDPSRNFAATQRREILDTFAQGIAIPPELSPFVDMPKLLPHSGGACQELMFRVRSTGLFNNDPTYGVRRPLTAEAFVATGIYRARLHYDESYPGIWSFEDPEKRTS